MSFRRRLALFFALIVVLPMVAVTAGLVGVSRDSRSGKADARLAGGARTALVVFREALEEGRRAARGIAEDRRFVAALESRSREGVRRRIEQLVESGGAATLEVFAPGGRLLARVGEERAFATARISLRGGGREIGSVRASGRQARSYVDRVRLLTGLHLAILPLRGRSPGEATLDLGEARVPESGDVEIAGRALRARTIELRDAGGKATRLALLGPVESGSIVANRPLIGVLLAGFFMVALGFAWLIVRAMQDQLAALLAAAKRIGDGDFDQRVPAEGNDEFAGLGREFNRMSERLGEHVTLLHRQHEKLEESIRRVGDAFASRLDRGALLQIVVEAVVDACNSSYGRASVGEDLRIRAEAGTSPSEGLAEVVARAEAEALAERGPWHVEEAPGHAVAHLLSVAADDEAGAEQGVGVITIARSGEPFSPSERELFHYLASQAAISIENVDLHELMSLQAVTDELTGLSNHRRFHEVIANEVERAHRFDQDLALIMLDVDNFKKVNDTYGHRQGDEVLRVVAGVLRAESREVDEPARYGGEEMAIAMPQTDLEGGRQLAERMRQAIEANEIPLVEGGGTMRVTASFGVAAASGRQADADRLISVADEALYRAKANGKNRIEVAVAEPRKSAPAEARNRSSR